MDGDRGAGGVRESREESAGCGREMQSATCCHLLMRYNTLKNKNPSDI